MVTTDNVLENVIDKVFTQAWQYDGGPSDKAEITAATELHDINLDSIDVVEIFMDLEEIYNIVIPDDGGAPKTVQYIVDIVKNQL